MTPDHTCHMNGLRHHVPERENTVYLALTLVPQTLQRSNRGAPAQVQARAQTKDSAQGGVAQVFAAAPPHISAAAPPHISAAAQRSSSCLPVGASQGGVSQVWAAADRSAKDAAPELFLAPLSRHRRRDTRTMLADIIPREFRQMSAR